MRYEAALQSRGTCILAGLTLFLSVATAEQDSSALFVEVNGGSATVIADGAPVREIVEEIAFQSGIIVYSRSPLGARVTYSLRQESIPGVLRRILKNRNFTLHYVSDAATGLPVFGSRLWIFADDATAETPVWSVWHPANDWTLRYAAGDSEKNRLRTMSNLATREDKSGIAEELFAAVNDPSIAVREEAIYGLSELRNSGSVNHLNNSLYDPERRVRVAAINALVEHGGENAAIILSGLLHDQDQKIRSEVIHAMADIGGDVAHHYLRQALSDANDNNRETAAGYLAELTGANLPE